MMHVRERDRLHDEVEAVAANNLRLTRVIPEEADRLIMLGNN